jgi:hypothetical protein
MPRAAILKRILPVLAAAGVAALLPGPAWAASGTQPASGTFRDTSITLDSSRVAGGNTIDVVTVSGFATGTFDATFTETDQVVIHPDASLTIVGKGVISGTLATCGTGSAPYQIEAQGTPSARSGFLQSIDQAASTSTPMKISSVVSFTVNGVTNEGTYTGTYQCT